MRPKCSASASVSCSRSEPPALWLIALAVVGLAITASGAERPPGNAAASPPKIGVVDIDKMLDVLQGWKDVQLRLREEDAAAQKTLADLEKEVNRIRAELAYFKPGSRDHEERKTQLAARQQELARQSDLLSRRLTERSQAALDAVRSQIIEAVREYAAANGFDVVVDGRAALYVAGGSDISLEVAREMNKRYKDGRKNGKSKP